MYVVVCVVCDYYVANPFFSGKFTSFLFVLVCNFSYLASSHLHITIILIVSIN